MVTQFKLTETLGRTDSDCPDSINPKHWEEWVNSGVSPSIIAANVSTLTDSREVDRVLNRNNKRRWKHSEQLVPCWEVSGVDPFTGERTLEGAQIKPDTPPVDESTGKPRKYLGAVDYDCSPLFLQTEDEDYWHKVYKDISVKLFISEGAKKSGCGLSHEMATVSLPGVTTCRKLGRLHEKLAKFCKPGRTVYLCFDNDVMQNPMVQRALKKLGTDIAATLAKVMVIQIPEGDAKGMDDFIVQHGEEEFKKLVDNALTLEEWKKELDAAWEREKMSQDGVSTRSIPPADILAGEIAEKYKGKFCWNNQHKTWMVYEREHRGVWAAEDDHLIECQIQSILESRGIVGYGTDSYIQNIRKFLARKLTVAVWNERENVLPFQDGVVAIATGIFEEHSPANKLTWSLPRDYNSPLTSDWKCIKSWLSEATQGNEKNFSTLIHFAAAVLRGRYDLQKFLYLWGDGGSGKGTYTRLLQALLGTKNCWSGKIESLDDMNQIATLVPKKLAVFPDQDKVVGKLQSFKNLTGGDDLTGKFLYRDPFNFQYHGMALVSANSPTLQGGGIGRWFERRALVVHLNYCPTKTRDLDSEFAPEIAAFTRYLLSISNEEINQALTSGTGTGTDPSFWEMAIRQDPLAAWVNEHIIFDSSARTQVGSNKYECLPDNYNPAIATLFGSYHCYCYQGGLQGKGSMSFSPDLEEILRKVLRHPEVRREKTNKGSFFVGIRLRTQYDTDPTPSEALRHLKQGSDGQVMGRVTDIVTTSKPCSDQGDGFLPKKSIFNKEIIGNNQLENSDNPSQTIENSHHLHHQQGFQPVTAHHHPVKTKIEKEVQKETILMPTPTSSELQQVVKDTKESEEVISIQLLSTSHSPTPEILPIQNLKFDLKQGDRILCYPTQMHYVSDWKVGATVANLCTEIQNGKRWLISFTLVWSFKGKRCEQQLGGGNVAWILEKA